VSKKRDTENKNVEMSMREREIIRDEDISLVGMVAGVDKNRVSHQLRDSLNMSL
jgi:NACalpha-BTF3-like transcription factor